MGRSGCSTNHANALISLELSIEKARIITSGLFLIAPSANQYSGRPGGSPLQIPLSHRSSVLIGPFRSFSFLTGPYRSISVLFRLLLSSPQGTPSPSVPILNFQSSIFNPYPPHTVRPTVWTDPFLGSLVNPFPALFTFQTSKYC